MRAFAYTGQGSTSVIETPDPTIVEDRDAIVRVELASACRSDLNIVDGLEPLVRSGRILGHEAVGTVVAGGDSVPSTLLGARVLVHAIWACGMCRGCMGAAPGGCPDRTWQVGRYLDGAHADFVRVPNASANLVAIPAEVHALDALFLADVFATAQELAIEHVRPDDAVLVLGSGPVGLAVAMLARARGTRSVIVAGRTPARLAHARRLGADRAVELDLSECPPVAAVRDVIGTDRVDVAVDTVGTAGSFLAALAALGRRGTLCNIAAHRGTVPLPMDELWSCDITIKTGLVRGTSTESLMQDVLTGQLLSGQLATDMFTFATIEEAYRATRSGGPTIKVAIEMTV